MSRILATATSLAVLLFCVTLSAQDRPLAAPSSTITVAGCLQHADRPAPETTPLSAAPTPDSPRAASTPGAAALGFVLTDAVAADSGQPAVPDAPIGTTGTKNHPTTYAVDGDDSELAQHTGHRVEITGTLMSPPPAGPGLSAAKRLHATSIKMIAADCTAKSN